MHSKEISESECNKEGKEHGIFHYRVKNENPYLSLFHAVSLLQTLLEGITAWVGKALSPQSGRQHTVTTVI